MPARDRRRTPRADARGAKGAAFALAVLGSFAAFASAQPRLSQNDREIMLAMLRTLRDDVAKHYYDPTYHGVDLRARFGEAEQRLKATPSFNDGIATLAEFLTQLDDSHTTFIPPNRRVRVDYGWQMAMAGSVPLIVDVDRGSDAAARGLAPGDRVLLLNTFEPTRSNLWRLGYFYRFIRPQTQQRVAVLKPDGSARTVDVASRVENKPITELGDLVEELERDIERGRDAGAAFAPEIFVWRMRAFAIISSTASRGSRTLILDLARQRRRRGRRTAGARECSRESCRSSGAAPCSAIGRPAR